MKKALVITGISLGGILLLAVAGFIVLMQPGVQKKLLEGTLAKKYGTAAIGQFQTKGGKLFLAGLSVENYEYSLEVGEIEADGTVMGLVLGKSKELGHLAIRDIRLVIKQGTSKKTTKSLQEIFSPKVPFRVDTLEADGEFHYNGLVAESKFSGDNLAAGESGIITWDSTGSLMGKDLESKGKLEIAFDETGLLAKFEPDFTLGYQEGLTLGARTTVEFGESVEILKSFITLLGKGGQEAVKLLELQGTYQQTARRMELGIKGSLTPETISQLDLVATHNLPQDLHLDVDFQGVLEKGGWFMDRGHLDAAMDGGKLGMELLQPFKLDIGKLELSGLPPGSKVLEINATVPPHWIFPDKWVTGSPLEAKFIVNSLTNGFEAITEKKLLWHGLKWKGKGQEGAFFDISGLPKFVKNKGKYLFQVDKLRVVSPDSSLVEGMFSAQKLGKATPWQWETEAIAQAYSLENLFRIPALGSILFFRPGEQAKLKASGEFKNREAQVMSGKLELASKWIQPWFNARTNQPFKLALDNKGKWALRTYGRLLEMDTIGFESDRIGKIVPELFVSTSPVNSHWALSNDEGQGLRLSTRDPLTLDNVTVGWDGVTYVQRGLLSGSVRFGITPSWELAFEDLRLGKAEDPLATGSFAFYDPKIELPWKGRVSINLPRASRSVLFTGRQGTVKRGVCHLEVGKSKKGGRTTMELSLREVEMEDFPDDLLNLTLGIRFRDTEKDPFELDFQTLETDGSSSKGSFLIEGKQSYGLRIATLHLDHILQVLALYSAWGGKTGRNGDNPAPSKLAEFAFRAKAGQFYIGNGEPLEEVDILVNSSESVFSIENLTAKSGEGRIKGFAHYRPGIAGRESSLVADLRANGIQTEYLQPPPEEGKPAHFSGLLDMHATLEAQGGDNLAKLLERAEVDLNADLKDGHYFFTQLDRKFDTMLAAKDKVKNAGEAVGSIPLGGILGETAENLANVAQQATNIVGTGGDLLGRFLNLPGIRNTLTKIEYETIHLKARREPIGKTYIDTFTMRGPVISIDSQGEIGKMPLWQIQDGPLTLDLNLGTKGTLESFFGSLGQLAPSYTQDGYRHFKANPVQVTGTLAKPRLRNLWKIIFPGNTTENQTDSGPKEFSPENTPGLYPSKSPLRKAFEGGIPFLPF